MSGEHRSNDRYRTDMALAEKAARSAAAATEPQARKSFETIEAGWRQLAQHVLHDFNALRHR
jgi:hypothetical protein